jgi:hypothetical protein
VASIGDQIETKRISKDDECVFSYRFSYRFAEGSDSNFFDGEIGWRAFHEKSLSLANEKSTNTVVICHIADFYHRIRHHRLDNALQQLPSPGDIPTRIINLLGRFCFFYLRS